MAAVSSSPGTWTHTVLHPPRPQHKAPVAARNSAAGQEPTSGAFCLGAAALACGLQLASKQRRQQRVLRRANNAMKELEESPAVPRRNAFAAVAAAVGALPGASPAAAERLGLTPAALGRAQGKVIVITGATSGVGLEAARTFLLCGGEVYVTGRTLEKAKAAVAEITPKDAAPGKAIPLELNLASKRSITSFVDTWKSKIQRPIDVLACNAGLALGQGSTNPEFTEDGFELTVGTNHLGHFLLVNLLKDTLSPSARIVVTASSVHDPATGDPGPQATLGDMTGLDKGLTAEAPMVNGGPYDPTKAYKDSKLCNVLFTLELARRLRKEGSQVTANCFSPGLIPSASFFRYQSQAFAQPFAFLATNVIKIAESTEFGGDTLAFMALDPSLEGRSGLFYSAIPPGKHVFVEKTPSPEALNEAEAGELWTKSAKLVGL